MYFSFTTMLVKTDLQGHVIGTVHGLLGHLGCIDYNPENGKVYGSLELKHDAIGRGIMRQTGLQIAAEDAFYIVIFDVEKIDREGMDAEKDGIMKAVYLKEVAEDYAATDVGGAAHRYGCSGIDGVAFGPLPGSSSSPLLFVAYGIYGDTEREGNDLQVLLSFSPKEVEEKALPLRQEAPHHGGISALCRYFLYTGNTRWGIQNLECDKDTGDYYAAVYRGDKKRFPNFPLFVIDGAKAPRLQPLLGRGEEKGWMLSLKEEGAGEGDIRGLRFSHGQTGLCSLGNELFYVSHEGKTPTGLFTSRVCLYRRVRGDTVGFSLVE